jgi:hypothetical protein
MSIFREELNFLDSFVMTNPCVKPFLGDEAGMLFVPKIARHINETLILAIVCLHSMEDGSRLQDWLLSDCLL